MKTMKNVSYQVNPLFMGMKAINPLISPKKKK
jgi:hypothetical protein